MVTQHPKYGHPFSKGWPPTMVNQYLQDGHPPPTIKRCGRTPSPEWSPTSSKKVNNHPQGSYHFSQDSQVTLHFRDSQQELEFDSSAAQLVFTIANYCSLPLLTLGQALGKLQGKVVTHSEEVGSWRTLMVECVTLF